MNVETIVYGGTESNNHKEGGQLSLKILFKNKTANDIVIFKRICQKLRF